MSGAVPLGSIAGIRIRAHWSVLVICGLLAWGLAGGVIPISAPDAPLALTWLAAVAGAFLLIASLTAHELGHALMARRRGVEVQGITLWLFGGMAQMRSDWETAKTELLVAAIGPAITFALAVAFSAVTFGLAVIRAPLLVVSLAEWLATVNVLLLVFNLVPAFPLDGGRILRALLWLRRKDRVSATTTAARGGRWFAFVLVLGGFLEFFATSSLGGLWLVLIGWFLDNASRAEERSEVTRHALEGLRVGDVMSRDPMSVPSWLTVELLMQQYVMGQQMTSFPIHDINGRIVGLVTWQSIKRVPARRRATTRARQIAIPLEDVPVATPSDSLPELLLRVDQRRAGRALVFEGDKLVGLVTPNDIAKLLRLGRGGRVAPVSPQP